MCFGQTSQTSEVAIPARQTSSQWASGKEKSKIPTTVNRNPTTLKPKDDDYGESMGLSMHAKHQKMIREAYPEGNVPEELKTFKETGMCQGALGGPVGGGVGMAMSSGI
ncbi:hypothetical protein IFR04_014584 [Cadophora malorum]|uniref:Uncharacterized protein n=1 Tax=Cadophora malorum TaxID=108018 RepID=A0A8H7T4L0_9HELO|nr:hypothetical protein IFR04_014584 [Cadophora malorum]